MATFEERLTAVEHDNSELKQKVELQTIAIGALVNKTTLEKLNERNDAIFNALMAHDQFTNQQLAEIREKLEVDIEGKIVGMQTEMRQKFTEQDGRIVGMQTGMRQGFEAVNARFDQIMQLLTARTPKSDQDI